MREHVGLSLCRGGSVASHCWKEERLRSLRFPVIDDSLDDDGDVVDAPASNADGHTCTGLQVGAECRRFQLFTNFSGYVLQRTVGEVLFH